MGSLPPVVIGIICALSGNLLISTALALQKHVHNITKASARDAEQNLLFYIAIGGLIFGEVGNFAAFGFASPSVVSPLGAVSVIANVAFASLLLGEPLYLSSVAGICLTVGGSVIVVLCSPPSLESFVVSSFLSMLTATASLIYFCVVAVLVAFLVAMSGRFGHRYLLLHLTLCSLLGSITVLCSSALSKFLPVLLGGNMQVLWVLASSPHVKWPRV